MGTKVQSEGEEIGEDAKLLLDGHSVGILEHSVCGRRTPRSA